MNKKGPIVIIEDDADDQHLLAEAFRELAYPNELRFFVNGFDALAYLRQEGVFPFIILSDVNMPRLTGYELRKIIQTDTDLASKCIPYLFFSTHASENAVAEAYQMSVQGFFMKPNTYDVLVGTLRKIVDYWQDCLSPGRYAGG